ncbi:MAG: hypothetical protein JWL62_1674 [Hyphomicrobiales bacterium]|nr:hypothetical protein [Hyphomicrobiales bacterium]
MAGLEGAFWGCLHRSERQVTASDVEVIAMRDINDTLPSMKFRSKAISMIAVDATVSRGLVDLSAASIHDAG